MTKHSDADFQPVRWTATQTVDAKGVALFHHAFGGSNAIHVDPEAAQALGGVVQHGLRTLFPIFAFLIAAADKRPHSTVHLVAKFLAPVKSGDVIETAVIGPDSGAPSKALYEISASNGAGVKVLAGTATIK